VNCSQTKSNYTLGANLTTLSTFLAVNAVTGLILGLVLILVPQPFLVFNGVQTDAVGLTIAQLFGAEFIGFNIATCHHSSKGKGLVAAWAPTLACRRRI